MSQTDCVRVGRAYDTVEFLDDETPGQGPIEAMDSLACGTRRPSRAVIVCVLAALFATWLATQRETSTPSHARQPVAANTTVAPSASARISLPAIPVGDLPTRLTRIVTQTMPGTAIDAVAVGPVPAVTGRHNAVTWTIDARYKHLLISLEITPGKRPTSAGPQTVMSGASDVYIIRDSGLSDRRTVTITVIAPHRAHLPYTPLQRIANRLARLSAG